MTESCAAATLNTPDEDQSTEFDYTPDGQIAALRFFNPATGAVPQTTRYIYGSSDVAEGVANGHRLARVEFPPSALGKPTNAVEYRRNRLGEVIEMSDQNGVLHKYEYDLFGRIRHDRVTGNYAGRVNHLEWTYDLATGLPDSIISHSPSGPANTVRRVYNARAGHSP